MLLLTWPGKAGFGSLLRRRLMAGRPFYEVAACLPSAQAAEPFTSQEPPWRRRAWRPVDSADVARTLNMESNRRASHLCGFESMKKISVVESMCENFSHGRTFNSSERFIKNNSEARDDLFE
jgi:hypothetical protein